MIINNISTGLYSRFQEQNTLDVPPTVAAPEPRPSTAEATPFSLVLRQTLENPEEAAQQLAMLRIQSQAGPAIAAEVVREDGTVNRFRLQELLAMQQQIAQQLDAAPNPEAPSLLDFEA